MSDMSVSATEKKRPTSLTVMGELGIIFSSLGLLGSFGGCAYGICLGSMTGTFSEIGKYAEESRVMMEQVGQLFQGLMIFMIVVCVFPVLMIIFLNTPRAREHFLKLQNPTA